MSMHAWRSPRCHLPACLQFLPLCYPRPQSVPISIHIAPGSGVVEIRAENAFALHRNMMPELAGDDGALGGTCSSICAA